MPTDPQAAHPPRFYWLKRLTLLYLLLMAATVGLRYAALAWATRKVDAQIAAYRAAGEPVLLQDFAEAPVADADNAVVELRAATEIFGHGPDSLVLPPRSGITPRQLLQRYGDALPHLRRARSLSGINWQIKFKSPAVAILLPDLNRMRTLVEFAELAAIDAHAEGRDAAALDYCRDILFIERAIGRQPFMVSALVAIGCNNIACSTVATITPTLRLDDPAARGAAFAVNRDLLDDQHLRDHVVHALHGERMMLLDAAHFIGAGAVEPSIGLTESKTERIAGWWLRPIFEDDARSMMTTVTRWADAAKSPTDPAVRGLLPPIMQGPKTYSANDAMLHVVSRTFQASYITFLSRSYPAQSRRRAVAIDLAARLYLLDHGRSPTKIDDLVPQYLPAVPIDVTRGGPMTYMPPPATAPTSLPASQ